MNFEFSEILDLIHEMGQVIQLCSHQKIVEANPAYGIPAQHKMVCRKVRGYVVPERIIQIALGNKNETVTGAEVAYINGADMTLAELTGNSRIVFDNRIFQIEYNRGHVDRGVIRLHQMRLVPTPSAENLFFEDDISK